MNTRKLIVYVGLCAISIFAMQISVSAEEDAMNSKRNTADKDLSTILPEDQSNEQKYIERTAAIRKVITDRSDISVAAQNIKIITLSNGMVVLRGPVETGGEKEFIESTAVRLSKPSVVKSYIEVVKNK